MKRTLAIVALGGVLITPSFALTLQFVSTGTFSSGPLVIVTDPNIGFDTSTTTSPVASLTYSYVNNTGGTPAHWKRITDGGKQMHIRLLESVVYG